MAAVTSSGTSSLALSGLASGINWTNIINDMAQAESAPIIRMQGQQTTINNQLSDYQTVGTDLTNLQNDIKTLTAPGFFQSSTTSTSAPTVATAQANSGVPAGNYAFSVSQMATAASQVGSAVSAQPISLTTDVSGVTLSDNAFADPIRAGTFTINGKTITVATTDTLQSVFTQINTATGGAVTATYDPTTDKITLASASPITLGSSADTSNFLQAAQLYSSGSGTVTSLDPLASINLGVSAANSNLSTAITNGTGTTGSFEVNGVAISYDATTDSVNAILQKINNSAAGVTATYDGANHRFVLANNNTGTLGMTLQDVSGNFLAATGLSTGALTAGTNLQYTLNGSTTKTSEKNTIDATSMGLAGLSITAQSIGNATITVSPDTTTIGAAINSFVNDYNAVQKYVSSQTTVTTSTSSTTTAAGSTPSSKGTPGILMGDMDAETIATTLRQLADASPMSGRIENLNDIGITSNGSDNTLSVTSAILNGSLATNLSKVAQLFTDPTSGIATKVAGYLTKTLASNGVVATKEAAFKTQTTTITQSITTLQQKITNDETRMQNEFQAMESAISKINVSKQYLTAFFNSAATTTAAPVAQNSPGSSG